MRILHVHTSYSKRPGVARHMFELMRLQEEAGHAVAPFATTVEKNEKTVWSRFFVANKSEIAKKMHEVLESFQPDVVHVHSLESPLSSKLLRICERSHIPVLMTLHDDALLKIGERLSHFLTRYRNRVARFLVVSRWQREHFLEYGFKRGRMMLQYPFVLAGKGMYQGGATILCFDAPGAVHGARMVKKVMRQFPEMQLRIVKRSADVSLDGVQAVVFPASTGEPFDEQLVSMMRSGVPVLVAEEGVFPELVEQGVSGLMFDPNRPETLHHVLKEVIEGGTIAGALSEAAGDRAEEISDEKQYLEAILAHYAEIIKK
jgi:glycosyltransferase involved in cell wall biosynthesis